MSKYSIHLEPGADFEIEADKIKTMAQETGVTIYEFRKGKNIIKILQIPAKTVCIINKITEKILKKKIKGR